MMNVQTDYLRNLILSMSRGRRVQDIITLVRTAARNMTGADGATFILKDSGKCYYVDEDAIGPLWKGKKFPLEACISGWAMINKSSTVIKDIYKDSRIPHDAYRPTFVKSLVMVPINIDSPFGAIGNYWSKEHEGTEEELRALSFLAEVTSVALQNMETLDQLEKSLNMKQEPDDLLEIVSEEISVARPSGFMISNELEKFGQLISDIGEIKGSEAQRKKIVYEISLKQLHEMDALLREYLTIQAL